MSTVIYRNVSPQNPYSQIRNTPIRDKRLSWKATGILCFLLSCSKEFDINQKGLSQLKEDGVDSVRSGMKELEAAGYIRRIKERNEKGQFERYCYVTDSPGEFTDYVAENKDFPAWDSPTLDEPTLEKPTQRIKKEELRTKEETKNNNTYVDEEYPKPATKEQRDFIQKLVLQKDDSETYPGLISQVSTLLTAEFYGKHEASDHISMLMRMPDKNPEAEAEAAAAAARRTARKRQEAYYESANRDKRAWDKAEAEIPRSSFSGSTPEWMKVVRKRAEEIKGVVYEDA